MNPAAAADRRSQRLSLLFSCLGHGTMHALTALFLTVVLVLERAWQAPYEELIRLWTLGALLVGLGAPLAGWLSDRWSQSRMMVAMFVLTGGGALSAGMAQDKAQMTAALAVLGLGASIYHPVGMAWTVKNAAARGSAIAVNGICGSIGLASAGLLAGGLSAAFGWRAAFLLPGGLALLAGIVLAALILAGLVADRNVDVRPHALPHRGDVTRAFIVLSVTMLALGLASQAISVVMPKWVEERLGGLLDGSGSAGFGVGGLVTLVYLVAGLPQLLGGVLADRMPIRRLYVLCLAGQVPLLLLAAAAPGLGAVAMSMLIIGLMNTQAPAENLLLAQYTPDRHRGLAYGAKFILSFGVGPLAVQLVAWCHDQTGDVGLLLSLLAGLAGIAFLAALLLPRDAGRRFPALAAAAVRAASAPGGSG